MNILRERDKKFQKKRQRNINHQKMGLPITRLKNLIWTIAILTLLAAAGYFAAPYIKGWFTQVTDAIE